MANRGTRIDMSEILAGLDKLIEAKEPVARSMGNAMGQAVRDEAKVRAPTLQPGNEGYDTQRPGLLRDAIYNAYDERRNILNPATFRYTVSWNAKKAPHGHLMEFGFDMPYQAAVSNSGFWYTPIPGRTARGKQKGIPREGGPLRVDPQPFLGPAFDAKYPQLMSIAVTAGSKRLSEILG